MSEPRNGAKTGVLRLRLAPRRAAADAASKHGGGEGAREGGRRPLKRRRSRLRLWRRTACLILVLLLAQQSVAFYRLSTAERRRDPEAQARISGSALLTETAEKETEFKKYEEAFRSAAAGRAAADDAAHLRGEMEKAPYPYLRPLIDNREALRARLRLISEAREEIWLSTYDWVQDETTQLLSAALLQAARRGVRIHLVIDDFPALVHARFSEEMAVLSHEEGIDVRSYNPIRLWSSNFLFHPERLHCRLHSKICLVDGRWLLIGGRNLGRAFLNAEKPDETGAKSAPFSGHEDVDLLLFFSPPAAREGRAQVTGEVHSYFETLRDASRSAPFRTARAVSLRIENKRRELAATDLRPYLSEQTFYRDFAPVEALHFMQNGTQIAVKTSGMLEEILCLAKRAGGRVDFLSPYIVADDSIRALWQEYLGEKTDVHLLCNSPRTASNYLAAADLLHNRRELLTWIPGLEESAQAPAMHSKLGILGDEFAFVGSMNMDLRSIYINAEASLAFRGRTAVALLRSALTPRLRSAQSSRTAVEETPSRIPGDIPWPRRAGLYFSSWLRFLRCLF